MYDFLLINCMHRISSEVLIYFKPGVFMYTNYVCIKKLFKSSNDAINSEFDLNPRKNEIYYIFIVHIHIPLITNMIII